MDYEDVRRHSVYFMIWFFSCHVQSRFKEVGSHQAVFLGIVGVMQSHSENWGTPVHHRGGCPCQSVLVSALGLTF